MPNPSESALRSNVPEMSVSELAFSLKRTLEETYGRVRVRGELGRITIPKSGHLYADLKDADSCLSAICWKGTLGRLSIKPEEGLEVICTGRITTYPARSNYQLIIESMELAGQGALLKMLEERKKKLAAEGLFDPAHKKALPYLPRIIGVVTSPTGAVIRDIMHRLNDRFPRHVLLWPVLVQGPGAAEQIAAAIRGFDKLQGALRPDVLIVARGGGSLEDLMAFNEEIVVRAAAECSIPLISAVGHETDTTLIDFASDMRAPTPTAAAELAVPVRLDLLAQVEEDGLRLKNGMRRTLVQAKQALASLSARLGDPARLVEMRAQRLDHAAHKLEGAFDKGISRRQMQLATLSGRLPHPARVVEAAGQNLRHQAHKLENAFGKGLTARQGRITEMAARLRHPRGLIEERQRMVAWHAEHLRRVRKRLLDEPEKRLDHAGRMLESLSFKAVLARGFAVVRDEKGAPVLDAARADKGQAVKIEFRDGQVGAVIGDK